MNKMMRIITDAKEKYSLISKEFFPVIPKLTLTKYQPSFPNKYKN